MTSFAGLITTNILFSLGWALVAKTNSAGATAVCLGTGLALLWIGLWFLASQLFENLITQAPASSQVAALWNWGTGIAAIALTTLVSWGMSNRMNSDARAVFAHLFLWSGGFIIGPLWMSGFDGAFIAKWIVIVALGAGLITLPFAQHPVRER